MKRHLVYKNTYRKFRLEKPLIFSRFNVLTKCVKVLDGHTIFKKRTGKEKSANCTDVSKFGRRTAGFIILRRNDSKIKELLRTTGRMTFDVALLPNQTVNNAP